MLKPEDRGRLYVLDLRSCGADGWPALLSTLPPERQRRVRACRREGQIQVKIAGRAVAGQPFTLQLP